MLFEKSTGVNRAIPRYNTKYQYEYQYVGKQLCSVIISQMTFSLLLLSKLTST